ncbi:MAG: hypothetical protein QNK23_09940 [Crocinitomicaceae bacterium]|nr:hypothetical protein [Crocinitomicaceae bacterium]
MKNIKSWLLIGVLMLIAVNSSYAQVEISAESTKKEKKKKDRGERTKDNGTSVFGTVNWSYTTRKLVENDGLFGKPLGERAYETNLNTWSFELGLRNKLNQYLSWEGGISYMKNGESYSYEGADSTYSYETRYSYVGMPLKLLFTYGEKIKLIVGAGVVPQMFVGYKQDREWTTTLGSSSDEEFKTKTGYSSFVISAVMNVGIQVNLGGRWSALFMPEYKIQLTSSDDKSSAYKHFGRSLGFNVGLVLDL